MHQKNNNMQFVEISDYYTGRDVDNQTENKGNDNIIYLIRKTSLLGLLSVITSLLAIVMISVINIIDLWFSIDIICTVSCIMLLFQRNQVIYSCCCGFLMGKVKNTELTYCQKCKIGCKFAWKLSFHGNVSKNCNETNLATQQSHSHQAQQSPKVTISGSNDIASEPDVDSNDEMQIKITCNL